MRDEIDASTTITASEAELIVDHNGFAAASRSATPASSILVPVAPGAPAPTFRHSSLGKPSAIWPYKAADGAILGYISRFDKGSGEKVILPLTLWSSNRGPRWEWRSWPRRRPLLGLDQLARRPGAPVLVVEGEKAATGIDGDGGAAALLPDWIVVTSPGGAQAAACADWSPVAGREVCIWPDADEAGRLYAEAVAHLVAEAGATSVRMVTVGDLPAGFDLGDALPDGLDVEARIRAATDCRRYFVSVGRFTMSEAGLFLQVEGDDEEPAEDLWISAPFEILGRARDPDGGGWGKWLRWRDPDGRVQERYLPDATVHGDVRTLPSELSSGGLAIGYKRGPRLAEYLNSVDVPNRITRVSRTGWHRIGQSECFVLPHVALGAPKIEKVILAGAADAPYGCRRSFAEWREGIGRLSGEHSRLRLAVSAAFAGPLLDVLKVEGGGLHFFGGSSQGKTTALQAAASVWGRGATDGFVRSWRATANAQEGTAAVVSDTLLALDEIGVAEAKDAAAMIYQLAAGVGKGRMRRDASLRAPLTWRVLALSTGETPMASKLEERGGRVYAGQSVRLLDIPADAGLGHGIFDHAGRSGDASQLANEIKLSAVRAYGTAGPAFVEKLLQDGIDAVRSCLNEMIDTFLTANIPAQADGQVKRAAMRLGLIGAAGELAREWGIVPWEEGVAMQAAAAALHNWVTIRGGHEPAEVREAIARVRHFIEAYGESRFEPIPRGDDRVIPDRYGYRRGSGEDAAWLILPQRWQELCTGLNHTEVARILCERGILKRDGNGKKFSRPERTPYGTARVYVVTAAVLSRDDDGDDDDA